MKPACSYAATHAASLTDPAGFWQAQARQNPAWHRPPTGALGQDDANGAHRWFADGTLNTAHLCLDHHVAQGRGPQAALVYDSPVTGTGRTYSYAELLGLAGALRGQVPVGPVVLKDGQAGGEGPLERALVAAVRARIGALACFRQVLVVQRLPKTRSGKILRKTLRQLADGEDFALPATIDDPRILDEIRAGLQRRGVGLAFGRS